MKMTALTFDTLRRFETEYITGKYTDGQIKAIERTAYVANMNALNCPEWTDDDIFYDFIRVVKLHHIPVTPATHNGASYYIPGLHYAHDGKVWTFFVDDIGHGFKCGEYTTYVGDLDTFIPGVASEGMEFSFLY